MKMSRTWALEREVYSVECRMGKNMTSNSGRKYLGVQLGRDAQLQVSGNGTLAKNNKPRKEHAEFAFYCN